MTRQEFIQHILSIGCEQVDTATYQLRPDALGIMEITFFCRPGNIFRGRYLFANGTVSTLEATYEGTTLNHRNQLAINYKEC